MRLLNLLSKVQCGVTYLYFSLLSFISFPLHYISKQRRNQSPVVTEVESSDSTVITSINQLPEEIISHVISRTTPRDACVSSAVSHAFRSAADSDATWHRFLPSDYTTFLSKAVDPVEYASKKELYFRLCQHPLLIDGGLMDFALEKSTGAKIFMISARKLTIVWGNDTRYWMWIPDVRFSECAMLNAVCWLEIFVKIDSEILTPDTSYAAHLIFKLKSDTVHLGSPFQETKVSLSGDTPSPYKKVCLNPDRATREITEDVILPRHRQDGWLEVELGVFYSGDGIDGEVEMSFRDSSNHWKTGLIVQGIEVRPQH